VSAGRVSFRRHLDLPGWSADSTWGYDEVYECYWVEMVRSCAACPCAQVIRIGPESLVVTVGGLADALAGALGCPAGDAYLALPA
jgi:hypothetical protein